MPIRASVFQHDEIANFEFGKLTIAAPHVGILAELTTEILRDARLIFFSINANVMVRLIQSWPHQRKNQYQCQQNFDMTA